MFSYISIVKYLDIIGNENITSQGSAMEEINASIEELNAMAESLSQIARGLAD
ncbi:MAG: hypothetical protein K6E49_07815 [Lachnospiraceae bacterium]|nr:hypothetical protein [Lachnospiraceae bacterium]